HPLPRQRRVRHAEEAARRRRHLAVRGAGDRLLPAPGAVLPLPLPRAAAARGGAVVRRGGRARRAARGRRLRAGARGDQADPRPPGRARVTAGTAEAVARLAPIARRLREHVIRMITAAGSGHPGGSLSAAEIVTVLFFHTLRRRQGDPTWPERDRFVISKGH